MTLTLRISNMTTLPDGGAVEYSCNQGRFEIGRDPGMDWTLPDPNRFVSGCHAEVRWENNAYWLYDVSTNGTFVNGASMRVKSPYQMHHGDKLQFGHYLVEVLIGAQAQPAAAPSSGAFGGGFGGDDAGFGGSFGGGDSFGGGPSSSDPFGGAASDPFGGAPGGGGADPFGGATGSGDPFGSDPFGGGAAGGGSASSDDPWAVPGVASSDSFGFDRAVSPPSAGDAGDEMIQMGRGAGTTSPEALGAGGPSNPFGGAPGAPSADASPFGAPPSQPARPPVAQPAPPGQGESPFGAPPTPAPPQAHPNAYGSQGSPFADPRHTAPPAAPPVARPPVAAHMPPSEGFGAMPQPAAPQAPAPPPTAPAPAGAADGAVLRAICEGAGIRPEALQGVDPTTAGYEIGQALRIVAAELASLLRVRSEGKQRYEKSSRTMIGREANNPLKFIPTPNEALEVMFGPPRQGYLRGPQTMQSSFDDIKRHQYAIQAALQPALARLLEDLSPEAIEDKVGSARFGSKSAKAWDLFVERWDAKTHPYENGMLDVFQAYFSDAYHDASKGR